MRTRVLMAGVTLIVSLLTATGARAVVLADGGDRAGVALVPSADNAEKLADAGVSVATTTGPCTDPWLAPDLSQGGSPPTLPDDALCWRGGRVMHRNETFALAWDPNRRYWATTRGLLQQFLQNVAGASGTGAGGGGQSPYGVTSQYGDGIPDPSGQTMNPPDPGDLALNVSIYGGGCIDFGATGGFTCRFGDTSGSGAGTDYPAPASCPARGTNLWHLFQDGSVASAPNDTCITDADIQAWLARIAPQTRMLDHSVPGYTPLAVVLTPPGVEVCLDAQHKLCSANGAATARFCSYHSQVAVPNAGGGTSELAYVVQPWTAGWDKETGCDDPGLAPIPKDPAPDTVTLANLVGARLVSPLSQAELAAIVDPGLNGWAALDGSEINDNGCVPFGLSLDSTTIGGTEYFLQREFNNAGVLESDPNALSCTDWVDLAPAFVVPSAVNQGDEVQFDGSTTNSTLIVPKAGYSWDFGDGTPVATGPSVVHAYAHGGFYTVTLTVVDRGGNSATLTKTIAVRGAQGQVVTPPSKGKAGSSQPFQFHVQLLPQALRNLLRKGVAARVTSNNDASGLATISIPRKSAKQAHIKVGRGKAIVIGRGTVSGVQDGTVTLHLKLAKATTKKLSHLKHLQLSVRLALVASNGGRLAVDVAGRY